MPTLASTRFRNHCKLKYSWRSFPLNDSSVPFCHGFPGSMNAVSICAVWSQRRIAVATNSGPLSERRCCGAPCTLTSCNNLLDPRIQQLIELPESVQRIRRIHHGLARLLCEEVQLQSELSAPFVMPEHADSKG